MSIEINSSVLAKELNQGIVPLGVPKAYQYDAALVEAARAAVNQGIDDVAEAAADAVSSVETQEAASTSTINNLGNKILAQIKNGYGYPFTAATAAAMTDVTKIYVYTGSEPDYTNGNWYYYNGSGWVSGGVYNSTAFTTDTALTVSGAAADAGAVGDNLKLDSASELNISNAYTSSGYGFYASNSTTFAPASNYYTLTYSVGNIKKIRVNIDSAGNANSYAYFRALDSNGTILSEILNPGNQVVIDNTITLPVNTVTFTVTGRPDISITGTNVYKVGLILSERNQAQIDDAKKGYDGKLYSTLGSSIRGQSSQLFSYLEDDRLHLDKTNYFTNTGTEAMYSSVETGYYRVGETEIVSAATSFKTYHYIAKPYEKITFSVLENGSANLYDIFRAYDADGNLIEHVGNTGTSSGTITLTKEISRDMAEIWITSQAAVAPIVSHYYTIVDKVNGELSSSNFANGEKIISETMPPLVGFYRVGETEIVSAATTYRTYEFDVIPLEEYVIRGASSGNSVIYDVYRAYDADGNIIDHIPNAIGDPVSFNYTIKIPNYVKKIAVTFSLAVSTYKIIKKQMRALYNTKGKTIVWFGTSIPAGQYNGEGTSYPEIVGDMLGLNVINEAVPSSRVHTRNASNVTTENPYGFFDTNFTNVAKCITNDSTIQQWLIDNYNSSFWTEGIFSNMNEANQNLIKSWGYEEKIDKYLTPSTMPDAFVFDFGRNDMWGARDWTFDENNPYSTMTSFQAAMNWIIKHILDYDAKAKIILIGHYTNQERNPLDPIGVKDYPVHIAEGQTQVAEYWEIPLFKLWNHTGWSNKTITVNNTNKSVLCTWLPDGLHPSSDATGKATNHLAEVIAPFISNNL